MKSHKIAVNSVRALQQCEHHRECMHLIEEVLCSNTEYTEQKEQIHTLERYAKKFNKETLLNLYKLIPVRLLSLIEFNGAKIQ